MTLDLNTLNGLQKQNYLQHAVAPRPVCFASTIDTAGRANLSPFSFFNLFSSQPPILIFSPSRRLRDNTTKHTLQNVLEVPEVVVNIVDFSMVQQMSLASCEYPKGINEFEKSGFTPRTATSVRPPMVAESKVKMECMVREVKPLGQEGGAGNLIICEVLLMHIDDDILDSNGMIDPSKLQHIARLGGNWYSRVDSTSLFQVEKPHIRLGIGVDALPKGIRESSVLSGNDLGQLANVAKIPVCDPAFVDMRLREFLLRNGHNAGDIKQKVHQYAKELLQTGQLSQAWQVLLAYDNW